MNDEERKPRRSARDNANEILENTGELVEHASEVISEVVDKGVSIAEEVGGNFKNTVREMLHDRKHSIMITVDDASLKSIDILLEAGLVRSRSEACAFLIAEGIKARQPLFDRISDKIDEIWQARKALQSLLDGEEISGVVK